MKLLKPFILLCGTIICVFWRQHDILLCELTASFFKASLGLSPETAIFSLIFFIQQKFVKYPQCVRHCRRHQGCSHDQDNHSLSHSSLQTFLPIFLLFSKRYGFFCIMTTIQLIATESILARSTEVTSVQRWEIQGPSKYRLKASFVPSLSQLLAQFLAHQRQTVNICWNNKQKRLDLPTSTNADIYAQADSVKKKELTGDWPLTECSWYSSKLPLPSPSTSQHILSCLFTKNPKACNLSVRPIAFGEGHGNPLHILAWRIPMDRGAWWDTGHEVSKSQTWVSDQTHIAFRGLPRGPVVKNPPANTGDTRNSGQLGFNPWVRKSPWRRKLQPTPVFLTGILNTEYFYWNTVEPDRATVQGVAKSQTWRSNWTHTHIAFIFEAQFDLSPTVYLSLLAVATLISILLLQHQAYSCLPGNFRSFKPQTRGPP